MISYCTSKRFFLFAKKNPKVRALVLPNALYKELDTESRERFSFILNENPEWSFYQAFIILVKSGAFSFKTKYSTPSIKPIIGKGTIVEDNVEIGENVVIGCNSVIKAGTIIGDNVQIGSCTVIGESGFQLIEDTNGVNHTIPHIGRTYIGNNVTVADNVTIARSLFEGYTRIEDNVKIDCQVHIAHNCIVGNNSVITVNTTLLGSCIIGENVWIAPNSLIMNRVKVGDGAFICAASFVMANVRAGQKVFGNPAHKID